MFPIVPLPVAFAETTPIHQFVGIAMCCILAFLGTLELVSSSINPDWDSGKTTKLRARLGLKLIGMGTIFLLFGYTPLFRLWSTQEYMGVITW